MCCPAGSGGFPKRCVCRSSAGTGSSPSPAAATSKSGYAYFANSFRALAAPGCKVARAEHGESFVAALERGSLLACQFHPELSGAFGHALMARWLEG